MPPKRAIAAVLVVVLILGTTPALAAIASYSAPIKGTVPITTDETPTIHVDGGSGSELNFVDAFQNDTLDIRTADGNITVTGDPSAEATIATSNIEGGSTQITQITADGAWLNLNPADKQRVDVRGDVDALSFQQIGVNDGSTDLQVIGTAGGSAEVRLHGLTAGETYALYSDARDEVLGSATADGSGVVQATTELPDGAQTLAVRTADSFAAPTVSDPRPTGQVTERPDELAVNVTADAFPATVAFTLDGAAVGTTQVAANGTATLNVSGETDTLGTYDWGASIQDGVGQTDSLSAQFETPQQIQLREEHDPTQTITDANVTMRFFTDGGDIAIERTPDAGGTIDMSGLPDSAFVVFADGDNHYPRTIYIDSIFEQETMYLLNETARPRDTNDAVRSRFIYEDLTGNYPQGDTTVQIERAVDPDGDGEAQRRVVAGDFWGASGEFEQILERGVRYRLVLVNRETGERNVAGTHIPTEELTQTVRVSGVVEDFTAGGGVTSLAGLDAQNGTVNVAYRDPSNATGELRVVVEAQGGNQTLLNETVDGPLGTYQRAIAINDSQADTDWVATVEANGGDRHRQAIPIGSGTVGLPVAVPPWLLTLLMVMSVTFVGALYGPRTALLGAWAMVFVAAGVAMFGWAFGGPSVLVAALVAVGLTFVERALPG